MTSTPLPRDCDLPLPSATIVSASAGAGKTHTLTLRFLQLLLSQRIPQNGLRNILAITFTNMAAAEMRRRVMTSLKELALGTNPGLTQQVLAIVDCDDPALRTRAAQTVEAILDDYSEFQVRTIDSFMARVFKASALEFGFQPDFDVALNGNEILRYAFDLFARESAEADAGMKTLRELVRMLAELSGNGERYPWDPYGRIVREVRGLLTRLMTRPGTLHVADHSEAIAHHAARLRDIARQIRAAVASTPLELQNLVAEDLRLADEGDWKALLARAPRPKALKTPSAKQAKDIFNSVEPILAGLLKEFNSTVSSLAVSYARMHYRPFATALINVEATLERVKRQRGEVVIDDINRKLVGYLSDGVVPEIYLVLGEQIFHYLLDEFQDTSPVQWGGLRVLIENAIAQGGTLFAVGDTKQSIYGFRGADWTIMKGLMDGAERFSGMPCLPASLDVNWRSDERIVQFVHQVFQEQVPKTEYAAAARASGLATYAQRPLEKNMGRGHVEVFSLLKDREERPEQEHVVALIEDAKRRGYACSDIAILTPSNAAVLDISGWLNRAGIPFLSHSSLDVRTRKLTGETIALLRFLDSPVDDLAFATVIMGEIFNRACARAFPSMTCEAMRGFVMGAMAQRGRRPLYVLFRERYHEAWDRFFDHLFSRVGFLPPYDLVCEAYKAFALLTAFPEEQGGMIKFLEVVKEFEANGSNSLKDFLSFAGDDEQDEGAWSIGRQTAAEAVTIMTVHKAKGLQFPVVIVLLYDTAIKCDSMILREADGELELWKVLGKMADRAEELQEARARELLLTQADALNRMYVALTRAKQELYVISVHKEKPGFPSVLLPVSPCDATTRQPREEQGDGRRPATLEACTHSLPYHRPRTKHQRVGFMETQRGDFVHRVLSRIECFSDTPLEQIENAVRLETEASHGGEATESLLVSVEEFLHHKDVQPFFMPLTGRIIRTEQEFLTRTGDLRRVDRLIVDEDAVTVVDFKTGGRHDEKSYEEQVGDYMGILRDVYPGKQVRGFIAYVDQQCVIPVPMPGGTA